MAFLPDAKFLYLVKARRLEAMDLCRRLQSEDRRGAVRRASRSHRWQTLYHQPVVEHLGAKSNEHHLRLLRLRGVGLTPEIPTLSLLPVSRIS